MLTFLISIIVAFHADSLSVEKESNRYKGIFYAGHGTSAFILCNTKERWWLDATVGNEKVISALNKIYFREVKEPYESLYLEAEGKLIGYPGDMDYLGYFNIEKIVLTSTSNHMIETCVNNVDNLK